MGQTYSVSSDHIRTMSPDGIQSSGFIYKRDTKVNHAKRQQPFNKKLGDIFFMMIDD